MLYMLLIAHSDPWGRGDANPMTIKSKCVPIRKQSQNHCEKALEELGKIGLIQLYCSGVKVYYQIIDWDEHQNFNSSNRGGKSKIPEPPEITVKNKITVNHSESLRITAPVLESNININQSKKSSTSAQSGEIPATREPIDFCRSAAEFINITDEQIAKWTKTYPAVNVKAQILKAAAWADANPKKAKKDWKKFLYGWISRAQEAGRDIPSNTASPQKQRFSTEAAETTRKRLEAERLAAAPKEVASDKIKALAESLGLKS